MKKILIQDDCAPDALEYFIRDFKRETGIEIEEFEKRNKADNSKALKGYIKWESEDYLLDISADFPYYTLYKKGETK